MGKLATFRFSFKQISALQHLLCDPEGVARSGKTAVHGSVQKNLAQLLDSDAVVECPLQRDCAIV